MNDENKNLALSDSSADSQNDMRLNLLYEIGRILASQETMDEAAGQILEAFCRNLRFELGELWCLSKNETALKLEYAWHLPSPPLEKFVVASRRFEFALGDGLPGAVWAQNAPVWMEDLSVEDKLTRRFIAEESALRSGFAFPIMLGEKLLGVCSFFSAEPHRADESLRQMFAAVGDNIGQFIKRERTESHLRESEENFRAYVQASSQAIWTTDENQNLEAFGWWENQTGQTREQSANAGFLDAFHPEDRTRISEVWANAMVRRTAFEAECRIADRHAGYRHFAVRGVPIFGGNNKFRQWIGTLTEITDRKLTEQSLRVNEERYRALVEATSTVVWRANENGELSFVHADWGKVSGQSVEEILGAGWLDALHSADRENTIQTWQQAVAAKSVYETEFRVLTTAGEYRWFAARGVPILNADGSVREWIGANTDIHERKIAEEKVRESEAQFRRMADNTPVMVWVTDATGFCNYLNQAWYDFTGQTSETALGLGWLDATHPDDAEMAGREFLQANEKRARFSVEYRLRRADGSYAWAIDSAQPRFDENGVYLGYIGSVIDISERKAAESRLTLLAGISELTRSTEDANELLFAVAQKVGEHLQVRRCLFNEIDLENDRETVHRDYCRGAESVAGWHRISDYSAITSAEMTAGKTVVNNDSKIDARTANDYARIYEPNGERAYLTVPLLRKNRWVASLWVSDDTAREWSEPEISLLQTVAERTWTAIEKLRINTALRESEERLQLAVDISRIATFDIDLATDTVQTDLIGREIYGFTADEPLTFSRVQSHFHPEDRDEVARRVGAAFEPEGSDEFEVEQRIIRTNGETRWLRVRGRAFFEGAGSTRRAVYCLGTYLDITSGKRNEELLLERERLALLNSDVSRALIKDDSLRDILQACTAALVKHLDAAFARIWTLDKDSEMLELQASSGIYTHLDGEHARVPVGQYKIGLIAHERRAHLTNSVIGDARVGNQEWAKSEGMKAFAGYPLLVENRLVGVIAMFARQPLTEKTIEALAVAANTVALGIERKQTESEREQLLISEQQARESAEEANRAKDEFIALVSHELRSPLNAMLGWTRILQNQNPDEATRRNALEVIVRNARSQSRLIEDLLDIARVAKGKLRLEMQPTEFIPIINAAVEVIKPATAAAKINLTQDLDRAADLITGDVDRLRQVIENLLSNAVKFTPPNGSISVKLKRAGNTAKVIISDTGHGISPEFLPHIFERFKQADPSTTRRHGGLGIGLSLARDLVDLHGGAISAESAGEGKGSTFIVTLPLRAAATAIENSKGVEAMNAQGKLSGFWILAVDDEADARELVSFMLQINGAKVTTANSAVEALDILKSSAGRLPDVLLSDISMPNESGYALLEKIRALPLEHGGQIPAVALTAFSRPEDREAAYDAGFQKHLGKPVEPDDLISAIIETAGARNSPKVDAF